VCVYLLAILGQEATKKILAGMNSLVQCSSDNMQSSDYSWTLNGDPITATTSSNIDSESINANVLVITSMSRSLAGLYVCSRGGNEINRIMVFIVGK